ncbi:MAG: LytTR family DNA-binding domain-containing protein [bacterium]
MITALLVDDEKKNRDSLCKLLVEYCPEVSVIGEAGSVNDALSFIAKNKPQLVFLDVEMPGGSGFDLLRQVDKIDFKIIFVTAHSHYAIKAIRFSAVDYLLKPVDTDDLIAAVKKAADEKVNTDEHYKGLLHNLNSSNSYKLAIPIKDGFAFLAPDEIIRLEADGTYTHIYTNTEKYTGTKNIKEYEQLLADQNFFRSHNSHLINLKHVKRFSRLDGYFVHMSDSSVAEISRRKKEEFIEMMSKH